MSLMIVALFEFEEVSVTSVVALLELDFVALVLHGVVDFLELLPGLPRLGVGVILLSDDGLFHFKKFGHFFPCLLHIVSQEVLALVISLNLLASAVSLLLFLHLDEGVRFRLPQVLVGLGDGEVQKAIFLHHELEVVGVFGVGLHF